MATPTLLRGEYWIIDGSANYADGDVGDTNHEGFALDHLRRKVLESIVVDVEDGYDWDELVRGIPAELQRVAGCALPGDAHSQLLHVAGALDLPKGDIDYAFERGGDVRDYMARTYGWIVCHGHRFSTWNLTREAVQNIIDGADDILFSDNVEVEDADVALTIYVLAADKTYRTTLARLRAEDFAELPFVEIDPPLGPNAQVAKMDKELEHPYYHGQKS